MNIHIDGKSYFLDYPEIAPIAKHGERNPAGPPAAGVSGTVMALAAAHRRFGRLAWKDVLRPAMALAPGGFGCLETIQPRSNADASSICSDRMLNAPWREPLSFAWRDMQVVTAPLPGAGGMALEKMLEIKSAQNKNLFKGIRANTARYIHLSSEIMKTGLSHGQKYLKNPEYCAASGADFPAAENSAVRSAQLTALELSTGQSQEFGNAPHHTTHCSIIDPWGNAVSHTHGLRNAPASDLSFGAPTLLLKDGRVEMVLGTPGGTYIPTHLYQVLANVFDYALDLKSAVAARRFHHQLPQASFIVEEPYSPFPDRYVAELAKRGYSVQTAFFDTDVQAIHVMERHAIPVADPRGRGWGLVAR